MVVIVNDINSEEYVISNVIKNLIINSNKIITSENINIRDHSLYCGLLSLNANSTNYLIAAALLHDIGHAFFTDDELNSQEADIEHMDSAALWLSRWFPEEVTEPIRLHVDAKRYLCTINASYEKKLSLGSRRSLQLQGGQMQESELHTFENNKYKNDALQLRVWDDTEYNDKIKLPNYDVFVDVLKSVFIKK